MLLLGLTTLSAKGIADCLLLTDTYWFVKAYMLLYILAPVINSFIENSSTNHIRNVLLLFFVFQTIFGFISDGAVFFENGYSTISFIGLYLLARYTKMNIDKLNFPPSILYIYIWNNLSYNIYYSNGFNLFYWFSIPAIIYLYQSVSYRCVTKSFAVF